jgi:protein TonB
MPVMSAEAGRGSFGRNPFLPDEDEPQPPRPAPRRAPEPGRTPSEEDEAIFTSLVASNPPKSRVWRGARYSLPAHIVVLLLIVLVPVFWPEAAPETQDYIRALIYNPPPAAAAPLPKGRPLPETVKRPQPTTPDPTPDNKFTQPQDKPTEDPIKPETKVAENEQAGSEHGSDMGIPEGMEGGVDGGVVGGIPGGQVGGCVGCTGDGPVLDFDQPPRLIKQTKPVYPQDAFIKKIEGQVLVEALIDSTGHVTRTRVIQSVPALDAAAIQCVAQWVFTAAVKKGRAVPTLIHVPVTFRIF